MHLDITRPQAQQDVQCLLSLLGAIGLHAYKRAAGFELSRILLGGIFGQTHSYEAADNIPHQRSNSRTHQRCEQDAACDDGAETRDQERGSRAQKSANEAAGRGVCLDNDGSSLRFIFHLPGSRPLACWLLRRACFLLISPTLYSVCKLLRSRTAKPRWSSLNPARFNSCRASSACL